MESSQIRDWNRLLCIGRQIPSHWTTREVLKISLISWLVHGLQLWADSQGHSAFLGGVSWHLPHQVPFPVYQSLPTWPALKSSCLSVPKRNRSLGGMTLLIVLIWCHTLEVLSLFVSVDQVPPQHPVSLIHSSRSHSHTFYPNSSLCCLLCCLLKLLLEDLWWPSNGQSNMSFLSLFHLSCSCFILIPFFLPSRYFFREVEGSDSEIRLPGFQSKLYYFLLWWLWASYSLSQCHGHLILETVDNKWYHRS